jgi:hypothetical protein
LSGTLVSCSDFLEIEPQNEITLDQFWNEKADVEAIMMGCYTRMQSDDVVRRMMIWGEFRSDNINVGLNADKDLSLTNLLKENLTASNDYTNWDGFYNVINRCNTIIKYAPEVAEKDPGYTSGELRATIAEASALRDLCYFYLIRTFRDVPISFEAFIDDDQTMALPATPFNEALNMLIADLESVRNDAVKRYPSTQPLYQTARITQDAIDAILCDMYLWNKDYQNCINAANRVIASKKEEANKGNTGSSMSSLTQTDTERTNGYPLISEYSGNRFGNAYNSLFITGNSQEAIFELTFSGKNTEDKNTLSNTAVSLFYGHGNVACGYVAPSTVVMGDNSTLFESKRDARYYEACNENSQSITKFVYQSLSIDATSTSEDPKATYGLKWTEGLNKSNWIIYRLTDIMLLKAEALTQMMVQGTDIPEPKTAPGSYLWRLNTQKGSADASLEDKKDTVDVERALRVIEELEISRASEKYYFIKGTIGDDLVIDEGKATFSLMSDDGQNSLLVSDVMGLQNKAIPNTGAKRPKAGDAVIVFGKLMKGMKLDESALAQNKVYIEQAFDLVNAVNKRSVLARNLTASDTLNFDNYQSKSVLVELIQSERQRELLFEGKRYYDLVRQAWREGSSEQLSTTVVKKLTSGSEAVRMRLAKMDGIFWPYNINELKVNTNLKQNPAFGSGESGSYVQNN